MGDTVHLSRSRVIETSHTQSEAGRQKIVTRKEEKTEEEGEKRRRKKEEKNGSGARGVALVLLFQFHIAPSVWNSAFQSAGSCSVSVQNAARYFPHRAW